jgi:signal transduction histidine kinase/CheY-like chemotaxis protein
MTILLLGAFSFPVVHIAWEAAGRLPSPLADAQETVAAAGMCVLGALAALRYQQVETDRSSLQDRYRSLEAAVLQAQKMEAVGRLAGGIAHDFNNLLTAIGGYADMLLDSLPASDPTAAAMTHVRGAVEQATRLTRQLLALSRRQVLKSEPVDVNDAIRHLVSLHENLLGSQVTVTMDPGAAPALAMVDPAQLQQVLLNVVLNGRDAMPSGGRLTLATSNVVLDPDETIGWPDAAPGAYVRVVVRDTGTGIPSDVLPRIFEPFFTTKPSGRGTGLGLSMVYGIVRQTGGRVTVETQAETGTAVVIDLPAARVPAAAPPAAAVRRDRRGTETVLVVEDEAAVRELVQAMLALGGYRILVAAGGDEALRAAAAHDGPIDLLLSDVVMPGMNGRALAERLLAARPDMRVLFMTGYTDDALVQHGVLDGAFAMLPKPFTRQALIDAVRGALDRPPAQAAGGAGGPGGLP